MGKHEVGTPKYIANKIKAKGLQKLKWYCQMCEKQCRDENGFKCHTTSESHQRQLLLFADNPDTFIDEFSKEFETGYLDLLKRQYGTKRVQANKVYQEYISDRNHKHMNATQWETLTEFVKWLGREGKCVVDETEKGWFVSYIDRDPEILRLQEAMVKKEKMDKDDNERMMSFLEKQIASGKDRVVAVPEPTELKKDENLKLSLQLGSKQDVKVQKMAPITSVFESETLDKSKRDQKKKTEKRKLTALAEIIKEEENHRKSFKSSVKDYWLTEGIVVKIITKSLGDAFFGKKGIVTKVVDKYAAVVKVLDTNHKLKLDQEHLETVIPNIGKHVKILNGYYSGVKSQLLSVNVDKFNVDVKLVSGPLSGKIVKEIPYEDVSKYEE